MRPWGWYVVAVVLLLAPLWAAAEEDEEIFWADIRRDPYVYIIAPEKNASYDSGSQLRVAVAGTDVAYYELELHSDAGVLTHNAPSADGSLEYVFSFDSPPIGSAELIVRGYSQTDPAADTPMVEIQQEILSPKAELIEKMIALAYANSKDSRYQFAPAQEDWDIGVCKNFVMRLFDTFSKEYRMLAYPDLALHMPVNNSKKACAPYDYGIEWKPESAEDGSPFEMAAQFKYNNDLSEEENAKLARELLVQIRKGDFFQIVGYYGGGNGPHSMYIIHDYDPITEMIRWTDSNMRGKRVDGARWGYMQFDADAEVDWWIDVFNMKKRGATLYRLRDDLFKK